MSIEPVSGDAPGWFGKISTLGDFAQRRLPPQFVQACDGWLSQGLVASKQALGEHWLDVYLTAPLMRFAWAPNIVGSAWWFGVLMPSCDNAGRYFPLLIAQRRARPPLDLLALDHLEAWFDHLAAAAAATLSEGETVERFEQALGAAPPWPTPGGAPVDLVSSGLRHALGPRASIGQWLHGLAAQDLQARFQGCSIWWRRGDAAGGGTLDVTVGLPDAQGFVGLLGDGT